MPALMNSLVFEHGSILIFLGLIVAILAYFPWRKIAALLRRYPLVSFFTLALAITWLAFIAYYNSFMAGEDGIPWFTFGPMVAGFIMAAVTGGKTAVKGLLASTFRWKVNPIWYVAAIGLPFATQLISVLVNPLFGSAAPVWSNIPPLAQILPMVALLAVFSGPVGEEIGWRGFALPKLLETKSATAASLIVGSVWAVWHLPLILVGDFTAYGAIMPVIAAFLFTWVSQNTRGSVLLAILIHAAYQNSVRYLGKVYTGADHVQQQWLGDGLWIVMIAALLVIYGTKSFANASQRQMHLAGQS